MIRRNPVLGEPFRMVSLNASEPPESAQGANWFRYVIGQGGNRIEGYRQGDSESVTVAVELMVAQLNDRRRGRYGKARTSPAAKKK